MKKIFLSLVLTVVSVFSISAQTPDKSAALNTVTETVKVESKAVETAPEPVKTVEKLAETNPVKTIADSSEKEAVKPADKTSETTSPEEKKTAANGVVNKPETIETVEQPETADVPKPQAAETEKKPESSILAVKKASLGALSTGSATIDGYIEEFCELYSVDPLLIYAQMNQESSFKARATSGKGASGYMQLMPDTARRFGVSNIYNPKQNIKAGVKYMRWLLDKFGGDKRLALAGYNAGEGSVMKYGNKIPPYRETQNYVTRIMNHYELITNQNEAVAEVVPTVK